MTYYIYGKHSFFTALVNPKRVIHKILVDNENYAKEVEKTLSQCKNNALKITIVSAKAINNILGFNANHQGYALLTSELPQPTLEDIIMENANRNSTIVILDQANDPHNIGAILRSCAAFNVRALIIPKNNSPQENGSIARSASGALETVPLIRVTNLQHSMKLLQNNGYWIAGFDGKAYTSLTTIPKFNKTVLIFGSEHKGMRELTRKNCDLLVKIPYESEKIESLNLSASVAIVLYANYLQLQAT